MTTRDQVRFESNERLDLGDANAWQSNARSYAHKPWHWFLAEPDELPNYILQGFKATASGSPDSFVHVANGIGTSAITLPDGSTLEHAVFFGQDGPSTQAVDLSALPGGTYHAYIRVSFDTGVNGNRIFYTAGEEIPDTIDTRYAFGWDVQVAASSPGDQWQLIADLDWDGSTLVTGDITQHQDHLFEGNAGVTFNSTWGAGNDRNVDRAQYGVFSFKRWNEALRKQLGLIIGNPAWYTLPTADLVETRAHIDTIVDAHSANPTWTGTVTADEHHWDSTHTFYDPIDMTALCAAIDAGKIGPTGSWTVNGGESSSVGFEGAVNWDLPRILLSSATVGNQFYLDISPYMRAGCLLSQLIMIAESDVDDIDFEMRVSSRAWVGTSAADTGIFASSQNIGNNGRKKVVFSLTGTPAGPLASASAGEKFYELRAGVTAVNGSAAKLLIYGMYITQTTNDVRNAARNAAGA